MTAHLGLLFLQAIILRLRAACCPKDRPLMATEFTALHSRGRTGTEGVPKAPAPPASALAPLSLRLEQLFVALHDSCHRLDWALPRHWWQLPELQLAIGGLVEKASVEGTES